MSHPVFTEEEVRRMMMITSTLKTKGMANINKALIFKCRSMVTISENGDFYTDKFEIIFEDED